MKNNSVAILEVGSQKITCIIGQRGVNRTFIIKSLAECDYDGFADKQFFDIGTLANAVKKVLSETAQNARAGIEKLYISVPGEFSKVKTREHTIAFPRRKRIRKREVDDLLNSFALSESSHYEITDTSALYYTLDDNRRVSNPEKVSSLKLGGLLCYMLGDKYYTRIMRNICAKSGIKDVEFISETLSEAKYLIPREEKDIKRVIIDIGYLTTNVFVTYGNGVLYQKAFSFGGGYITAQLMKAADVDFEIAERLKRKINLGYDISVQGNYQIAVNDEEYNLPLQKSNYVVRSCIDYIAESVNEILNECPTDLKLTVPVGLTGGGISHMRGAKEYLSTRLEVPVGLLVPMVPAMNKPSESACLSILDEALSRNEK